MAQILLLTVDLDLPDAPVNGGVLRIRQLKRHLTDLGHEVQVSMPFDRLADLDAPSDDLAIAYPEGRPQVAVEQVDPDVILCEQWHLASVLGPHSAPLWIDLHGSLLGENAFRQAGGGETYARYDQETRAKLRAFGDADVITCAGHRQRLYFRGWRAIAGRSFDDWEVHHLPLAIEPQFPDIAEKPPAEGLRLLYAGNLWPWIDLQSWLPSFFDVVASKPEITVDFFVDDPLRHRDGTIVLADAGAGESWKKLLSEKRVRISGRVPHQEFADLVGRYDAAIDLFSWNSERELALTTRTLEYLSFGLPVIYPSHSELAETIAGVDRRWIVNEFSRDALEKAVESLGESCAHPSVHRERIRKALERRTTEAADRCDHVMRRLGSAKGIEEADEQAGRRLVSLANDVVRGSLVDLTAQLTKQRERAERGANRLIDVQQDLRKLSDRKRSLDAEVHDREKQISALQAAIHDHEHNRTTAEKEIARLHDSERALSERHTGEIRELAGRHVDEIGALTDNHADEIRVLTECHTDEINKLDNRLRELTEEHQATKTSLEATHKGRERRLSAELNQLKVYQSARQTGAAVAQARPELKERGILRRARLWWLYVDHLFVRVYLAVWQRLRGRRIFPGM